MANEVHASGGGRGIPWRIIGWGTAALLLLLPIVTHAPWTLFDFALLGTLLGGVGLMFELIVRKSCSLANRLGAALAVVAAVLTIIVNGAVGMIGSEDNIYNLLFVGVAVVALVGAILARFEPMGMTRAMIVAAVAQGVLGMIGLATDVRGGILSMTFAGLWLLAAALFANAARNRTQEDAAPQA